MKKYKNPSKHLNEVKSIGGHFYPEGMFSFGEMYVSRFLEIILENIDSEKKFEDILNFADTFENIGDFIADDTDLTLIAAYGLVVLDRLTENWLKLKKADFFYIHEQLFECCEICGAHISKSAEARKKANLRHKENRAMKKEVFSWLEVNRSKFKSMDATADAIAGKIAPIAFRTARDWVGEWKKLRSASKP